VLVLLNFSKENAEVEVRLPEEFKEQAQAGQWLDLLSGEPVSTGGADPPRVLLPALQAYLLKLA
jgi:hypothetical protein